MAAQLFDSALESEELYVFRSFPVKQIRKTELHGIINFIKQYTINANRGNGWSGINIQFLAVGFGLPWCNPLVSTNIAMMTSAV
jgi:hypothetical protein